MSSKLHVQKKWRHLTISGLHSQEMLEPCYKKSIEVNGRLVVLFLFTRLSTNLTSAQLLRQLQTNGTPPAITAPLNHLTAPNRQNRRSRNHAGIRLSNVV